MKSSGIVVVATAVLIGIASGTTVPPDAPNPPFSLSSLQERCDDQTGAAIVASVGSEYHFTLRPRSEIHLPSEIPLTMRIAYRGGALTCYPAIIPPEGSTRPQIAAQVGVVMEMQFLTAGGAFNEQFGTEIKGRGGGGLNFEYSTTPDKLQGTYRPDLPNYSDVGVGFVGYFGGDLTNGEVVEFGIPPGHVSELIPVAEWAAYLDHTPVPTPTPAQTPTPTGAPACTGGPFRDPSLSVGSVTGVRGQQVTLPISLLSNGYHIVTIAPLVLEFDASVLTFQTCEKSAALSASKSVSAKLDMPGRVSVFLSGDLTVIPDAEIMDCVFVIAADAALGRTAILFVSAGVSDGSFNDVVATGCSGSVAVTAIRACIGDCNGDGTVTVDEIVRMVTIALNGEPSPNTCPGSDQWCGSGPVVGAIGITCLVDAVHDALYGCPVTTPTPTCVPFPPLTPTFTFALEPSAPRVGEHATLSVRITGGAPQAVYNLFDPSGLFEVRGPTYTDPAGSEVDFDLNATQAGTTDLVLAVFYTIDLPGPDYCYASRYQDVQAEPFPVTVASVGDLVTR